MCSLSAKYANKPLPLGVWVLEPKSVNHSRSMERKKKGGKGGEREDAGCKFRSFVSAIHKGRRFPFQSSKETVFCFHTSFHFSLGKKPQL